MASVKRRRLSNVRHQWRPEERLKLLRFMVAGKVNGVFEKPNAVEFYRDFLKRNPIPDITGKIMKDQVRSMRLKYSNAVAWLNETGEGLLANGSMDACGARGYIEQKLCINFDLLHEIFHDTTSVVVPEAILDAGSPDSNLSKHNDNVVNFTPRVKITKQNPKRSTIRELRETVMEEPAGFPTTTSPSTRYGETEEMRIRLEERRLEWEIEKSRQEDKRSRAIRQFELEKEKMKLDLQREQQAHELKVMEMKQKHELELARIKANIS